MNSCTRATTVNIVDVSHSNGWFKDIPLDPIRVNLVSAFPKIYCPMITTSNVSLQKKREKNEITFSGLMLTKLHIYINIA